MPKHPPSAPLRAQLRERKIRRRLMARQDSLVLSAGPVDYALETGSPYNPGQPPPIYRP